MHGIKMKRTNMTMSPESWIKEQENKRERKKERKKESS
jgi:hypothetical protein